MWDDIFNAGSISSSGGYRGLRRRGRRQPKRALLAHPHRTPVVFLRRSWSSKFPTAEEVVPDDLTVIKGIGPAVQEAAVAWDHDL
jgi:hypothetical protein